MIIWLGSRVAVFIQLEQIKLHFRAKGETVTGLPGLADGLFNIQFIVDEKEDVYIIEVDPRSSRTVPFLSKATGYPLADIATA